MGNPTGDFLGGVPAACFKSPNPCGSDSVMSTDKPPTTTPVPPAFDQEADDPRYDCNCGFKTHPQNN